MPMLIHDESALIVESIGMVRLARSAVEGESAISAGVPKTKQIGIAEDVELADFVPAFHHYSAGKANEEEFPQEVSWSKNLGLDRAEEQETAGSAQRVDLARTAQEQEQSTASTWSKGVTISLGHEQETCLVALPRKAPQLSAAIEAEAPQPTSARKRYPTARASETEAGRLAEPKFLVQTVFYSPAVDGENSLPMSIGRAYEQSTAFEEESAAEGVIAKLSSLNIVIETEGASSVGAKRTFTVGQAQEAEDALAAAPLLTLSGITSIATESETAGMVTLPVLGAYQEIIIDKETEMTIDR